MVRRTRRELELADHLWDAITRIAEDSGTDRHAVVNQAVYEFARRFNFLTPVAKEVPAQDAPPSPARNDFPAEPEPRGTPASQRAEPSARAPERARRTLYVVNSAGEMHKIDKDTFIIGRSRTCDLVIASSKVSRQHSGISREQGEYFIEDLGSANGVWKDGVKIQKERIHDGDEFMISEEVLKFIYR